jgi:mono/diheme cytochrome c family protein
VGLEDSTHPVQFAHDERSVRMRASYAAIGTIGLILIGAGQSTPGGRAPTAHPATVTAETPAQVYSRLCVRCHEDDGRGEAARDLFPKIPDFTDREWQATRSEAQLLVSVLQGRGTGMPPFRRKLSEERARALVGYVRAFGPGRGSSGASATTDFDARFRQLEAEFEAVDKQIRALSKSGRNSGDARPRQDGQSIGAGKPAAGG